MNLLVILSLLLSFNLCTDAYFDYVPKSTCLSHNHCKSQKCELNENRFCGWLSKWNNLLVSIINYLYLCFYLDYFKIREKRTCHWYTCAECSRDEQCPGHQICTQRNSYFEKCDREKYEKCVCLSEPWRCKSDYDCIYNGIYRTCVYVSRYNGRVCAGSVQSRS